MHLLKIEQSGDLYASGEAVDLGQTSGRIAILTAADSEISLLAEAARTSGLKAGDLRLANLLSLSHPYSIDLYIENTLAKADMIMVRLLGGTAYWSYGVEQLSLLAREKKIPLAIIPGDGRPDPELERLSTLPQGMLARLAAYLDQGGLSNAQALLASLDDIISGMDTAPPPKPLMKAGLYWPGQSPLDMSDMKAIWKDEGIGSITAPIAAIVCYRALMQSGQTAPVDALIAALSERGIRALPIFTASLKDPESAGITASLLEQAKAGLILNATSFAVSDPGGKAQLSTRSPGPFGVIEAPVIQIMFSSSTMAQWQDGTAGLNARDLAMNVVLPELDGRIISRAIGFKTPPRKDPLTQAMVSGYTAHPDRAAWVADLSAHWLKLAGKPRDKVKLAIIMANYPNRDGRLANGVGLDTPASALSVLRALDDAGYQIGEIPENTMALMDLITSRPTNSGHDGRVVDAWLPVSDYISHFKALPESVQDIITKRWGKPQDDPMVTALDNELAFALPVVMRGGVSIAIQPSRGYNIDPKASYHSPDLPPPHNYLAFYFWCRHHHQADAIIHLGKHGNLEWLPGKALALDATCMPEICLGPMPHFYPFIVNDPGEGSQAKRRAAAVILDHLTPPMTLADSHGIMAELEASMDEYYEAAGVDQRRGAMLVDDILSQADIAGLANDCGILDGDSNDEKLQKLDNFLCDIKEMQIRSGLHIYGVSAPEEQLADLLTAILRIPRGDGTAENQSILRALARDLLPQDAPEDEQFDPLTTERALPWLGARPKVLDAIHSDTWRSHADTVERLNLLAANLVAGRSQPEPNWHQTRQVLENALPTIRLAVEQSPEYELRFLLRGLEGKYIPAGPSGAPTRGRPEVLPTGRNFFSVDTRAVPTPAAWRLGWASASVLIDRYLQDHGNYPEAMVLSVWGTANMRTGGDDLAQALALIGVEPKWDSASRRVTGFNVMPVGVLGRPRVDVTLRASGFFRDAFPAQIALFDKAVQAVARLDEPEQHNPLAARWRRDRDDLMAKGKSVDEAERFAGFRVFSAMPGAYGAGMQTLIDEGIWSDRKDFAETFLAWGSYAYGDTGGAGEGVEGVADKDGLSRRLKATDAVIHNQDNREHDILDSDDYYQFAGGLAATVAVLKGQDVPIYMGDHALAEQPRIRTLGEEISRVVRGRASNPKWINGVMRHGYKGAFEMAATLDYLFAFAATTRQVENHHFDALFEHWVEADDVATFIQTHNPHAWQDILNRFQEALDRGLWQPRRNITPETLARLQKNSHNTQR